MAVYNCARCDQVLDQTLAPNPRDWPRCSRCSQQVKQFKYCKQCGWKICLECAAKPESPAPQPGKPLIDDKFRI